MSFSNVQPQYSELSPMRVSFDGVDVGGTKGGVQVMSQFKYADIMFDQFGDTPVDSVVSGQAFMIKLALAEVQLKDNWKRAFPNAKLITSGGNKSLYVDSQIGAHLLALAKQMILHPLSKDDSDLSENFLVYKAACKSVAEVKYGPNEQTVLECEFVVFPDTSIQPARFYLHGDPSIGAVAASAGAAVAGGGNTGNGTVSGVSAPATAITETITMTCVTPQLDAGKFFVSGSVSGALGLATVGVAFVSSKVNFTINDGSTDFALNDSFTIAVTGPNYA